MRLAIVGAAAAFLIVNPAPFPPAWEKPVAPGVVYRQEQYPALHQTIHALKISLNCPAVRLRPDLVGHVSFSSPTETGRGPLSKLIERDRGIAGVNGDFFSMEKAPSGDPLGITVRDGQLLSTPSRRIAFGWGPGQATMAFTTFGATASQDDVIMRINGINRKCGKDEVVLDTPAAGLALAAPSDSGEAKCAICKFGGNVWSPSTVFIGSVDSVSASLPTIPVQKGEAVLVGEGKGADVISGLKIGGEMTIALVTKGFDWTRIDQVIGGGPMLVRNGDISIDAAEEGFPASFSVAKHPRTAIGRTADGDIWLVAVDGRAETGDGMTLAELAETMKRFGCTDAMNLDGGGSTTMNVLGATVNHPSDGRERAIADGLVVEGAAPQAPEELRLVLPPSIEMGKSASAFILEANRRVPNVRVFWGCTGACKIDQGGNLTPVRPGTAVVQASVAGKVVAGSLTVG